MKLRPDDRDEEIREIKEIAQKRAERVSMRFVVNDEKVRRFRDAASHEEPEAEPMSTYGGDSASDLVFNT